ncbi:DUF995 domain-containing protein [Starkeya sp. 3C]|uniref:DUF995 domain-containing protein n=1 Tax=Ancylobacter moscoviensis TaxID=2597768 RepID=A0ABY3DM34_9HYPH|nr:DUF995 domain-containing protein [Ancylobacter moscoviensis]TSJ60282.1 DUF995 domain-containing protein [Ancylobacter moscoviensis]
MTNSTLTCTAAAAALSALLAAGAPAGAQAGGLPQPVSMVQPHDLAGLYAGKTWMWSDGAAYFAPNRRFIAWSGSGKDATYAEGEWRVTPLGRLCFSAIWRSRGPSGRNITCFGHRMAGGQVVYQQREPGGDWYVFKHMKPVNGDEYFKFKDGDQASAGVTKVKQELKALSARS